MIEVRIPYKVNRQLGVNYNELMEISRDWVCFVDHDILICNPRWFEMLTSAVERLNGKLGLLTGVTNRIACADQCCFQAPRNNDIQAHWQYGSSLYQLHGDTVVEYNLESPGKVPFSGFLFLTHKKVWEEVGGFSEGFLGVDNDYHRKVYNAGYKTVLMPGLYCYHIYKQKKVWHFYKNI